MSGKFRTINRNTAYLLPPSLQDWLPDDHLARFVVDIVERLDLKEIETAYGGGGKAPYHPALLISLLFYGYATGVFSSRKLEKATYDSVAFRFITADSHPDHDTIATFRKRFLKELEALFVQILVIAKTLGLFKMGNVSLDGTKIKANASKHKAMSWGYANKLEQQLRREVEQLLKKAEEVDTEEEPELDIPDELRRRKDRLVAITKAKEEIAHRAQERFEAEQAEYEEKMKRRQEREDATGKKTRGQTPKPPNAEPKEKDQVNFTDKESRIMPSSSGYVQAYNAQAAVDTNTHLIVESHLTQQPNDRQEVGPTLARLNAMENQLDKPGKLLADTGYFSEGNVNRCETAGITPYICDSRERHNLPLEERLKQCEPCPKDADAVTVMRHRLSTPEGKSIYAKRKSTVETVFGIIKEVMGFRQFHLRGCDSAQGEWNLVCMAWNLKRMHALAG